MKMKSLILNNEDDFLHHAYLIEGERELILLELFDFFEKELKFPTKGNPDFLHLAFESFGIDEGRRLKELQSSKAIQGDKRFFVVDTTAFTHEAQNSLLKVFEDPTPNTYFFVITASADGMLPTLKSRFLIIEHETKYKKEDINMVKVVSAKEFLENNKAMRLAMVKSIIDNKNKESARILLNDIEALLHRRIIPSEGYAGKVDSQNIVTINEISRLRQYLHDRSASIKLVVEHLAVILPTY